MQKTSKLENEFEGIIIETRICRFKNKEGHVLIADCLYCDGYDIKCNDYAPNLR